MRKEWMMQLLCSIGLTPTRRWKVNSPDDYPSIFQDGFDFATNLIQQRRLDWRDGKNLLQTVEETLQHELNGHDAFDTGKGARKVDLKIKINERKGKMEVHGRHRCAAKTSQERFLSHVGPALIGFQLDSGSDLTESEQLMDHVLRNMDKLSPEDIALAMREEVIMMPDDEYQQTLAEFSDQPDWIKFCKKVRKKYKKK